MTEPGDGTLLVIVGGQPMIVGTDKCLEVLPGLPGKLPEKDSLAGGQARDAASKRPADPPRDNG
ncbi:MAG: hypothetical protein WBP69_21770, partial [Terriglobales bacterium]